MRGSTFLGTVEDGVLLRAVVETVRLNTVSGDSAQNGCLSELWLAMCILFFILWCFVLVLADCISDSSVWYLACTHFCGIRATQPCCEHSFSVAGRVDEFLHNW